MLQIDVSQMLETNLDIIFLSKTEFGRKQIIRDQIEFLLSIKNKNKKGF